MEKNKLLFTLKTFSSSEMNAFYRFLQSPYFNHREDVIALFELFKIHLKKQQPLPSKEICFQKIYDQSYNDQKFRLLKSYLTQLVEQFMIVEGIVQDSIKNGLYLAKGYRERGLQSAFEKTIKKVSTRLEKLPYKNADYFELRFQLLWEQHLAISVDKPTDGSLLKTTSETMDNAYLSLKLKHFCLLAAHKNVYNTHFETGFLTEILNYVERVGLLMIPVIGVYYYGYLLQTQPDQNNYFKEYKRILFETGASFHPQEIRLLYLLGINHAIQRSNYGDKVYLEDLKDLYEEGLKNKYLFEEGKLSRFSYLNIISTGITTKDYDWVEHIIYTYKEALEEKYRATSFHFNLARLEYYRKNYQKALPLLQKSQPQNVLLNLAAKTLLTKIYYELDEIMALGSHLDAMKNFIRRKKIMGYHRTKYIDFIHHIQKMIKLNPYDKSAKQKFIEKTQKEEDLMEKEWILEQLTA